MSAKKIGEHRATHEGARSTASMFAIYLLASPAVLFVVELIRLPLCQDQLRATEEVLGGKYFFSCDVVGLGQATPFVVVGIVVAMQTLLYHRIKVSEFVYWWMQWMLVSFVGVFFFLFVAQFFSPIIDFVQRNLLFMISMNSTLAVVIATARYPSRVASRPRRLAASRARKVEIIRLAVKAEKDEAQKVLRQRRHKPTREATRWGLMDLFSSLGAVEEGSGLLLLESRFECQRCFGLTTVNDTMEAIYGVERSLKPAHKDWLSATRAIPSRYKAADYTINGQLRGDARPIYAPSVLQEVNGYSASEAKAYIAATEKLKLFASDSPSCQECINGKSRASGRRPMSPKLRRDVLMRDRFTCQECGANRGADPDLILHIDHIQPVAAGGQDEMDNLQVLCIDCNLGKSDDASYM